MFKVGSKYKPYCNSIVGYECVFADSRFSILRSLTKGEEVVVKDCENWYEYQETVHSTKENFIEITMRISFFTTMK